MNKSYSKINVLKSVLDGSNYKNVFDYFVNNKKYLTIEIPYIDYIRGNVFIQDMKDNFSDVPYRFDIGNLIFLLYDDFLTQIKSGANNKEVANFLLRGKSKYINEPKKEKKVLKPISKNTFSFEMQQEEVETEEKNIAYIDIKMRENEILRGEVLLHDLEQHLENELVTIENILAIRYLDFIYEVKKNGNSLSVQKNILTKLIN